MGGVQVEDQANLDAFKLRWHGSIPIGSLTARRRTTVSLKCRLCVTAGRWFDVYAEEKTYKVNRAKGKTMKSRISQIVNEQFMFSARRRLSLSLDCFLG